MVGVVVQRRVRVRAAVAGAAGADVVTSADTGGVGVTEGDIAAGGGVGGRGQGERQRGGGRRDGQGEQGTEAGHGGPLSWG